MADIENLDLAVVKALSRSRLTKEEAEEIVNADQKYFLVDQGLDFVQSQSVKKWAKEEILRHDADKATNETVPLEEGLGSLGTILTEEDLGRMLDYGGNKSDSKEGRMAKQDLYKIAVYGDKMHQMLDDHDDLPEWCLKYIYLSSFAISKVYHYLDYKIFRKDSE